MRVGARIAGRYRLVEGPIRGGTGEVWLAEDTELGRRVALKRARFGDDRPGAFDLLRSEARALARFSHPHVVTLYDVVPVKIHRRTTPWLVLEYVTGGSLETRPAMPPRVAARIGAQIAEALAALHAEGIVHCDVKPANIVVTGKGTAKLTDFGAAYRFGGKETISRNGSISHTPAYAPPEVVNGRPEPASDVYSLGMTVYSLATGGPPGDLSADVGPLTEVVAALVRPDPKDRPDVAEALRMLDEAAGATRADAIVLHAPTDDDPPRPEQEPASGWRRPAGFVRRHPWPIAVTTLVVAALVAAAFIPGDGAEPAPAQPKPVSRIGDPRTADPCALTNAAALGKFGEAELDNDYGNFDRCDVIVTSGDASEVDVHVDLNPGKPELTSPARRMGDIQVVEDPDEKDECGRLLLLPSVDADIFISIDAKQNGKGTAPLCAMADTAVSSAAAVLNHGPVPRRPPLPARSLAHRDACGLLRPDALDVVPGIDARNPRVDYGGWGCEWDSTTEEINLHLRFDRGQPLSAEDGSPTVLRGHRAFVEPDAEGNGTCLVRVVHRTYSDQNGDKAIEMLYLVLEGDSPTQRLCTMATTLAGSAAAQL
ncbi:hypothetical protein GCM10022254_07200 [Actinomadura meridiana]|uniref:non-specific serine/threonine protein kinase n=1 Tax=Actinomadura meridiana TaxID=559626 RepID=A0ABP8BT50_9ACTN